MDVEYEIANPLTLSVRACTCPGCHLDFGPTACCPAAGLAVPACMRSCAAAGGARGMRACVRVVPWSACLPVFTQAYPVGVFATWLNGFVAGKELPLGLQSGVGCAATA